MKKIKSAELLKRILICLICIAIIISIASLFAYLHAVLLSKGYELAASYVDKTMPYALMVTVLFMLWFIYDQVFSKIKEVELPISIELANSSDKKITFADFIIDDELKQRLQAFFSNKKIGKVQEMFENEGINSLGGCILCGSPGNGKTLIARAIAGESNMNFISISGPELIGLYVGHGAHAVRELFKTAKKHSPCIVFIDEIDAVALKRKGGLTSDSAYHHRESLTQLLTEIDGFESRKDIIVIAATNFIDEIDKALIRFGRLGQVLYVSNPKIKERQKILDLYVRGSISDSGINLKDIAKRTEGYSGAKLKGLVYEAKLCAALKNRLVVNEEDFNCALQRLDQKRSEIRPGLGVYTQREASPSFS